jgi:putative transposase
MRYVERNAIRAGLVGRARDWEWSSLSWRFAGENGELLAQPPVPLPTNWERFVEAPQTAAELEAIRLCVNRQRPYGAEDWVRETAPDLGLDFTVRPRGRPRKQLL